MFLNAVAIFAILASVWWIYTVYKENNAMPPAIRFFGGDAEAGKQVRRSLAVIVIAILWLIFG